MEYEYRRGSNAAQAARNINDVYGANTTNQRTACYWIARFRSGNIDMKNDLAVVRRLWSPMTN